MKSVQSYLALALFARASFAGALVPRQYASDANACPGYNALNVKTTASGLTADLVLAGPACNVHGTDLADLTLTVEYQTGILTE
jgi:alpha-glucosidase